MSKFNDDLEQRFRNLGFPNYQDMLIGASHQDELVFLEARHKLEPALREKSDCVDFLFVVVYPENKTSYYIEFITASLKRREQGQVKTVVEKGYWYENGALPSKSQMVGDLLESEKITQVQQRFQTNANPEKRLPINQSLKKVHRA